MTAPADLAANQPSFSVASLTRKCMAVAFGSKVILARYRVADTDVPDTLNALVIEDGQLIRDVAFVRVPDGPVCLVTVGDGKYVSVYNISSRRSRNRDAFRVSSSSSASSSANDDAAGDDQASAAATAWAPAYRYGPHAKRITRVAGTDEGVIIFADKFGEVYRLRLCWSPQHTIEPEGDTKSPAEFLLQHFSVITRLYMSPAVPRLEPIAQSEAKPDTSCRRLFTCDRDRHARVSWYPEAHHIEQFLWTRAGEQAVVTSIATVPSLAEEEEPGCPRSGRGRVCDPSRGAPYSYYVTGYQSGRVSCWAAHNGLPMNASMEAFRCFATLTPDTERGAVVAVVYLEQAVGATGARRHPRDTPRGIAVAHERSRDVVFYPVFDNIGQYGMRTSMQGRTVVTLPDLPAGMVRSGDDSAAVVLRTGRVVFVRLTEVDSPAGAEGSGDQPKLCSFNANIAVKLTLAEERLPLLEKKIAAIITEGGRNLLERLDLSASWRSEFDRKHEQSGEDDKDSSDDADGGPEKKRARAQAQ